MSPSELYEIFDAHPQTPFRLTLSSGDTVIVDNPKRTLIELITLYVGQSVDPRASVAQRTKIVSIPNIALVEKLDSRSSSNGPRRREIVSASNSPENWNKLITIFEQTDCVG